MRRLLIGLLCVLLVLYGLSGANDDVSSSNATGTSLVGPVGSNSNGLVRKGASSPSSDKKANETLFVAADGSIYLWDMENKILLWSMSSGPSIYSSYQGPLRHENDNGNALVPSSSNFIDIGDDWNLYIQSKHRKEKAPISIAEYVWKTPEVAPGGVLLGSKKTTVFQVDANTGRFMHTYRSTDPPPTSLRNEVQNVSSNKSSEEKRQSDSVMNTDEILLVQNVSSNKSSEDKRQSGSVMKTDEISLVQNVSSNKSSEEKRQSGSVMKTDEIPLVQNVSSNKSSEEKRWSGSVMKTDDLPLVQNVSSNKSSEETRQSGSVMKTDGLPLVQNVSSNKSSEDVMKPLYITRTDYTLEFLERATGKVLWNVTVADIGAVLCQEIENSFGGTFLNSGYELPSEPHTNYNTPVPCQSKAVVYGFPPRKKFDPYRPHMLPEAHHKDKILTESTSSYKIPLQPNGDKLLEYNDNDNDETLPVPISKIVFPQQQSNHKYLESHYKGDSNSLIALPSSIGNPGIFDMHNVNVPLEGSSGIFSKKYNAESFILGVLVLVGVVAVFRVLVVRKQAESTEQLSNMKARTVHSKRKKIHKRGKNSDIIEKNDKNTSVNLEDEHANIERVKLQLNLNYSIDGRIDGRRIGKLFVSNIEIAKGSNGTIVFEGIYEGRPVAVKRLVKTYHDLASKEIQNLIASDRHPNIVRWYGVEEDHDFVYLSLERCSCNLYDLIQKSMESSENPTYTVDQAIKAMTVSESDLHLMRGIEEDVKLWKPNGLPSPTLLKLMRDVVSGLVHLHELGIIHRDLKPQNVLIVKERSLHAKLSDMGISKQLIGDMSSLSHHATGYGSAGWQAPEQLLHGRQTRAVDIFSLGCVLFFCITGGRHPFGDNLERDINITKNRMDLFLVENLPEAVDLFSQLLDPNAELRPKASEVLHHPLFWNSEMRLAFLRDVSDRVELEDREAASDLLKALESTAPVALGGKWDEKMEPAFINNIGRYRRYKFDSVRDLLRVMRNKLNHYRELPLDIQEVLGTIPEGFDSYFSSRFPKLLIEVYKVMHRFCSEEEFFHKYFKTDAI